MNDKERAVLDRIQRCAEANTADGMRMRHCESCEVPVGTMKREAFYRMGECPTCGNPVNVVNLKGGEDD